MKSTPPAGSTEALAMTIVAAPAVCHLRWQPWWPHYFTLP